MLAVGEGNRAVGVYDVRSGNRVGRWELPRDLNGMSLYDMSVSDDGRKVVANGSGVIVVGERIGDAAAFGSDEVGVWSSAVLRDGISQSGFSTIWMARDGTRLIAASNEDGTFRTWNLPRTPGYAATWPEQMVLGGEGASGNLSARGRWVFYSPLPFGGVEPRIKPCRVGVYDTHRREMVREFDVDARHGVSGQVSADGARLLLSFSAPQTFAGPPSGPGRWSLRSLRTGDDPTRPLAEGAGKASFSDDGRWVIEDPAAMTLPGEGVQRRDVPLTLTVRRAADGAPVAAVRTGEVGTTVATTVTAADGTLVVITHPTPKGSVAPGATVPLTFRFLDPETGKEIGVWEMPMPCPIQSLPDFVTGASANVATLPATFFSPDGRKLGVALPADDGSVRAWVLDKGTGKHEQEFVAPPAVPRQVCGRRVRRTWPVRSPRLRTLL